MPSCARCGTPLMVEERACPTCGEPVAPTPDAVSVGDLFREAWAVVTKGYGRFLMVQGPVLVVLSGLWLLLNLQVLTPLLAEVVPLAEALQADPEGSNPEPFLRATAKLLGVVFLATFLLGALLALAVGLGMRTAHALREQGQAAPALGPAGSLGTVVAVYFLVSFALLGIVLAGLALSWLILPLLLAVGVVIYFALKWALAYPVGLFEPTGAFGALARSGELTRGYKGKIFLGFLLAGLFHMGVTLVATFLATLAGSSYLPEEPGTVPTAAEQVVSAVGSLVGSLVAMPLYSALLVVFYRRLAPAASAPVATPAPFAGAPPRPPPF
ncbi:MAG TPA: hypothetical protein VNZ52_04580 [Candidatus Thermoplasmatota archaeon]|nr:hypothetical protein [Candidatus Thermoplasmatota archaeon]